MRQYVILPVRLLWATVVTAVVAQGTLVPNLDLQALTDDSDIIVVGQVLAIRQQGRAAVGGESGTLMQAELEIAKTLKGQPAGPRITFEFFFPDAPMGYGSIPKGQFGVFFLRRSPAGYEVLYPYHPFVVASSGSPPAESSILHQVIAEVAYVLRSSASSEPRMAAVLTLDTARTAASTAALRVAASGPDLRVRCFALGALMRRNDISLLPEAQRILLHPPPDADSNWVNAVAFGIRDGIRDVRAVPRLQPLLHASSVEARRAAAAALRTTEDPSAIGPLTEALWDPDRDVRYYAVVGLGEITGQNEWTPAIDHFAQNEERFLSYWREWAKSRKPPGTEF